VPTSEGAAFAARTGCLFVEASAKTAVGVTEAFDDVVTRIIDTPSLWNEEKPKSSGRTTAAANTTAASGPLP
jgi:Ras-related protein Rab-18